MLKQSAGKTIMIVVGVILLALVTMAVVVIATQGNDDQSDNSQQKTANADDGTIRKINNEPGAYYGKSMTLKGQADESYNSRAFKLVGNGVSNELLVIFRSNLDDDQSDVAGEYLNSGTNVEVKGTVRQFVVEEIKNELGVELSADVGNAYRSRPVLVAESIRFTDKNKEWKFSEPVKLQELE